LNTEGNNPHYRQHANPDPKSPPCRHSRQHAHPAIQRPQGRCKSAAAIDGTTAKASLPRLEKQVFLHEPDLLIVCFGLNDVNGTLEDYLDSLKVIFEQAKAKNCDTIFMTPNMLNTYVPDDTPKQHWEYAFVTAEMQNSGKMDNYIYSAVKLAQEMDIPVCDCYSKWKKLAETEDTTMLLANRINHPTPEMHKLFADSLYEMIMKEA
jgi:lysophospholipase L1-like esterase